MEFKTTNSVALGVPDRRSAVEYYVGTLGFQYVKEGSNWIELSTGALRLFICDDDVKEPVFDIAVEDVGAATERLVSRGCVRVDLNADETYVRDPFGYLFCISPIS